MRLKTLILSVVVLAALSAIVAFVRRPSGPTVADARIGQSLVDQNAIENAAKIRISDHGRSVTLTRRPDSSWQVASYFDFPADFSKLSRLVNDLTDAKIERLVTTNPERIARLEFKDTKIELLDAANQPLQAITVGKTAESGNGRFLQLGTEPKAYLATFSAWLDTEPKNWADTALVKMKPEDIATIEIPFSNGISAAFTREKKDDPWKSDQAPSGQTVNADKLSTLLGSLTNVRFSDTAELSDPKVAEANAHPRAVKLTTFDGKTLSMTFARTPEQKKLKPPAASVDEKSGLAALGSISDPASSTTKAPESDPKLATPEFETIPAGPVFVKISSSDSTAPINALMQKRAFQISDYPFTSLPHTPADLFKTADADAKE